MASKLIKRHLQQIIIDISPTAKILVITGGVNTGKTTLLNSINNELTKFTSQKTISIKQNNFNNLPNYDELLKAKNSIVFVDDIHLQTKFLIYLEKSDISAFNSSIFCTNLSNDEFHYFLLKLYAKGSIFVFLLLPPSQSEINNRHNFVLYDSKVTLSERRLHSLSVDNKLKSIIAGESLVFSHNTDEYYDKFTQKLIDNVSNLFYKLRDSNKFTLFLQEIAKSTNELINFRKVAKIVQCDERVIKKWTYILVALNLIFPLESYANDKIIRSGKKNKFIFLNSGYLSYLLGCTSIDKLKNSPFYNKIIENYAISEVIKGYSNSGMNINNIFYYLLDTNHNRKVDLIIKKHDGKIIPILINHFDEISKSVMQTPASLENIRHLYTKPIILTMGNDFIDQEDGFVFPIHWI